MFKKKVLFPLLALVVCAAALFFGALAFPTTSHAANSVMTAQSGEDADFPGNWMNHKLHLNPSNVFKASVAFTITGDHLPANSTLTLWSDFKILHDGTPRCSGVTNVDGTNVFTDVNGNLPAFSAHADGCPRGRYVITAVDTFFNYYPAILTVS